jgi:hypothetical protein
MTPTIAASIPEALRALAEHWAGARAAERANAQSYLTQLAQALQVDVPRPAGTGYEFEYPVRVITRDGTESMNFVDLYRQAHFVLEAKDSAEGKSTDLLLRKAFGQAQTYAHALPGIPTPFLMVLDVAKTLLVWDRFSGSYGGFNAGRRIDLARLHERTDDIAYLRAVWQDPESLNPGPRAAKVTEEIARRLADLARNLESRGHDAEQVARFLIRCVFTMFAEDMGLLQDHFFEKAIQEVGFEDPEEFSDSLTELWRAMDQGKRFGLRKLLRFNGHFFHDAETLPLNRQDLAILLEAAQADWRYVEPSIFGTLLVRALDPTERHKLGAEYTPRAYVERLVRPTVEEPVRERWTRVQAEVLQLRETGRKRDETEAVLRLRQFHDWLRSLRILDPACGSGNFLYVTLSLLKRIELEVLRAIEEITGQPDINIEEVGPWQFHGIEVKPWARELAELTLWIGYHQAWAEMHGEIRPPEPVLRDTGTLELRDAVLAWDEIVEVSEKSRPDPTPRIEHPVTGKPVPDPNARLHYLQHRGARPAEWPTAEFIVGNPPYMGQYLQRDALGDGYVDALRATYPQIPDSADLVMYWWHRAAHEVASGRTIRAGLITTRSIADQQNRVVIANATGDDAQIIWAIPDHPWVDTADAAAVWVAMTVIGKPRGLAVGVEVDAKGITVAEVRSDRLNSDLTAHADVSATAAIPLLANAGIASRGFKLHGPGFILSKPEAESILNLSPEYREVIRPFRNGSDITRRPRGVYLIDFALASETETKQFPIAYDLVRDRVKPERDANNQQEYRRFWWRFGRPRAAFREAVQELNRYLVTTYVAKHTIFSFLSTEIAPDDGLICIASDDTFMLGILSSTIHSVWAEAAGGVQGKGHTPRYNISVCLEPFPFPTPPPHLRVAISQVARRLDEHREAALTRDERVTMTGMYNVVEKLHSGEALTAKEREIHEIAACGVLRDLHDELDALVAEAYGWPWPMEREEILERLVALHDQRAAEEETGRVRWLRPEYQVPRFGRDLPGAARELDLPEQATPEVQAAPPAIWPSTALEQIAALQALPADRAWGVDEAASRFRGARREIVARHLETLAILGELRVADDGRYRAVA